MSYYGSVAWHRKQALHQARLSLFNAFWMAWDALWLFLDVAYHRPWPFYYVLIPCGVLQVYLLRNSLRRYHHHKYQAYRASLPERITFDGRPAH